jgi:hypothetical protein
MGTRPRGGGMNSVRNLLISRVNCVRQFARLGGHELRNGVDDNPQAASQGGAMRTFVEANGFRADVIIGSHVALIALDCDEAQREGLLGFGFRREPTRRDQ